MLQLGLPVLDLLLWLLDYPAVSAVSAATFRTRAPEPKPVQPEPALAGPSPSPWERLGLRFLSGGQRKTPTPSTPEVDVHDVEDAACAVVHLATGVSLMLDASWSLHCAESVRTLQIYGDEGGAELWPLRMYRNLDGVPVDVVPRVPLEDENVVLGRHFIECIQRGTAPRGTAAEGAALMEALESIYRAAGPSGEKTT